MHSDSSPCKFRADLVLRRNKRRGYGSSKAHPNAFIEAAKMHLAMLPLVFNCKYQKHKSFLVFSMVSLKIRKNLCVFLLFSMVFH